MTPQHANVLVILHDPEVAPTVLKTAEALCARLKEPNVDILYASLARNPDFKSPDEGMPTQAEREAFSDAEEKTANALQKIAEQWINTSTCHHSADFEHLTGDIEATVAGRSRRADFIVIARPSPKNGQEREAAFGAALFDTQGTLLVSPTVPVKTLGRHPVVAWHASQAMDRTIGAATVILQQAEQITVLIGSDQEHHDTSEPDFVNDLRHRGIPVTIDRFTVEEKGLARALCQRSADAGGDLMIMGAHTHPKIREWLFGSVTDDIFAGETLPVLAHH